MNSDNLTIAQENIGEKKVRLTAKGQITATTADKLKKKLDDVIKEKNNYIIVNMKDVSFLSSGGIRVLLMYYKIMKGSGGNFFVQEPSSNVRNVLGMVALEEMLYK